MQHRQRRERRRHEQQLRQRRGARDIHQGVIAAARAEQRHGGLDQRQCQRQHQRVMPGFRDHFEAPCSRRGRGRGAGLGAVIVLPVALLLQGVGDLLRHVGLVMLGQHGVGLEHAGGIERAFGDDALPFAEQVRQNSLVGDRQRGAAVGDAEIDREIVAAHQRARLHQAAEAEPLAGRDLLLGRHRRRGKEHDGIAHRVQHQRRGDGEHRERTADHGQTPLLARHVYPLSSPLRVSGIMPHPSSPRFFTPSLSWRKRSASLATAWRASASALAALSRSPITI